ncbi:MAG: Na/Pi cotransporter family protein [Bacteroidia bacterium]
MDTIEIVLSIIGGLVLFLYAVNSLSETIKEWAGENAQKWIARFAGNDISAVIVGAIVTTILDSSSAVIILTIVLVNGKLLTLRQAIGIVMGANIGTTVSSQILAMDVGKYSPISLVIGLLLLVGSKNEKVTNTGRLLLFFGMLFFGLYTMERAVEPLKDQQFFVDWIKGLENPFKGAVTGAIVTLIIQSSSATVGMAITLAKKGLMTLPAGIAVMLGAELGTCSDTLLATIRGSRVALKTGLFHLFFNFITIVIGLLIFIPFIALVVYVSGNVGIERQVANAHMIFNIMGVVLFFFFIPKIEKLLNRVLPDIAGDSDEFKPLPELIETDNP